jgi:hypothetical protein
MQEKELRMDRAGFRVSHIASHLLHPLFRLMPGETGQRNSPGLELDQWEYAAVLTDDVLKRFAQAREKYKPSADVDDLIGNAVGKVEPPNINVASRKRTCRSNFGLKALKQWTNREQMTMDGYLFGRSARQMFRTAANACLVTGEALDSTAELHHPVRDGRPPILLSKNGHAQLEGQTSEFDVSDPTAAVLIPQKG